MLSTVTRRISSSGGGAATSRTAAHPAPQRQLRPMIAKAGSRDSTKSFRIDSHVHVWAPKEMAATYPYAGQMLGAGSAEPPMPGESELLLQEMQALGVCGALVVQPSCYGHDHSYVTAALKAHPGRLVGCLLADPHPDGRGVAAMEELAAAGYRAVRFNPYLWPEGQAMTNEVGRALYAAAGRLGLPVGHMLFKGFMRHVDEVETLLQAHPDTKVLLDHLGFVSCADRSSEEWSRLLALAAYPQAYVKASALFRVSQQPYPHTDACEGVALLVAAFGARRVVWGTDWPWVTEKGGYARAWSVLDDAEAQLGRTLLTPEERRLVEGESLAALLPGAWGDAS